MIIAGSEQKLRRRVREAEETGRRLAGELDSQTRAGAQKRIGQYHLIYKT